MTSVAPNDTKVINDIVDRVKKQGLFDQFRKECLADVDTKPAYQNLRHRVEGFVARFLSTQKWSPDLNKNQLRDNLRRQINQTQMLSSGVDRIVEQVVNPKIYKDFKPQIDKVICEYLGIDPAEREKKLKLREELQRQQQQQQYQQQQQQQEELQQNAAAAGQTPPFGSPGLSQSFGSPMQNLLQSPPGHTMMSPAMSGQTMMGQAMAGNYIPSLLDLPFQSTASPMQSGMTPGMQSGVTPGMQSGVTPGMQSGMTPGMPSTMTHNVNFPPPPLPGMGMNYPSFQIPGQPQVPGQTFAGLPQGFGTTAFQQTIGVTPIGFNQQQMAMNMMNMAGVGTSPMATMAVPASQNTTTTTTTPKPLMTPEQQYAQQQLDKLKKEKEEKEKEKRKMLLEPLTVESLLNVSLATPTPTKPEKGRGKKSKERREKAVEIKLENSAETATPKSDTSSVKDVGSKDSELKQEVKAEPDTEAKPDSNTKDLTENLDVGALDIKSEASSQETKEDPELPQDTTEEDEAPKKVYHFAWDDMDSDKMSDVTITSVHTSDLSSFTSGSDGEYEEEETTDKPEETVTEESEVGEVSPKKEVKEMGAVPEQEITMVTADLPPKPKPRRLIALQYNYSDSEDEETREERKARIAQEKEERYIRRQQRRAELEAKRREKEEEKARLRAERQKDKEAEKATKKKKVPTATLR